MVKRNIQKWKMTIPSYMDLNSKYELVALIMNFK